MSWRELRKTFGEDAELYDRITKRYLTQLTAASLRYQGLAADRVH